MTALGTVVRSGVRRRRLPSVIIALSTLMATASLVLGGTLLVASSSPFDAAFARQHGAHVTARFSSEAVTAAKVAASRSADGVSAWAGPFRAMTVSPRATLPAGAGGRQDGNPAVTPPLLVVERDNPAAGLDDLALTEGRWAGTGEIVVTADRPEPLGTTLSFPDLPNGPVLTVVGKASSATRTAGAWVSVSTMDALAGGGASEYQMLYRLRHAATIADLTFGLASVRAAVGGDAMTTSQTWLDVRADMARETALFVPFLSAFGVIGVVMAILVVGMVITSAVSGSMRRIGVLKAVGFTPAQVIRGYVEQSLIPSVSGAMLGLAVGNLLAVPVLAETQTAYGTGGLSVSVWVNVAAVAGILAIVAVTALAASWRAGRLRTVDALAVGRVPRTDRGVFASRLLARVPVPRAISLGLSRPFVRPSRALTLVACVALGTTAITFTAGLSLSLNAVLSSPGNDTADVVVRAEGSRGGGASASAGQAAEAVIVAEPGTARHYSTANTDVTVDGIVGEVHVEAFRGDASWGGFEIVNGRWVERSGEVVVPTQVLKATQATVGDRIILHDGGTDINVLIVGEVFDTTNDGKKVFTQTATLGHSAAVALPVVSHHIAVDEGVDVAAYVSSLNVDLAPLGLSARPGGDGRESTVVDALNVLSALLTTLLITVSALSVLGAVVLDTQERAREIGIQKALGMSPRQTVSVVVASVVLPGMCGGAMGALLGRWVHTGIVLAMGDAAGLTLPRVVTDVYGPLMLGLLGFAGVIAAVAASLPPATRAAHGSIATVLRTE
jgi:putative ABC transport system permease protein